MACRISSSRWREEIQVRDAVLILSECGALPPRVRSWTLFSENFRLIMSASHRLAAKPTLVLHDLDGEDVIERATCSGCQLLRQLCTASGVMPRFRHRVDRVEQLLNLVRAGFGVGFTAAAAAPCRTTLYGARLKASQLQGKSARRR
jgi:DNA-binding transcriptional LysR family regulator